MSSSMTPNMNLVLPGVGTEDSPNWANDLNSDLSAIDQHNHSSGQGVQINPTGLNINADLPFNIHNATLLRTVRFSAQISAIAASSPDLECIYVAGVDLYYNDGSGNQVRITQSGSVAGASGTITGLPSGTASAAFSAPSGTFVFQQATSTGANIDVASIAIRYPGSYPTPSGNYIQLQAPSALASGYSLTLPSLPSSNNTFVTISTAGALGSVLTVDNSTITLVGNQLVASQQVPAGVISAYGGSSAPTGYLLCDGTSYLRASFPALFTAISTHYGTADGTHFNVPDLRGRFQRGVSAGTGRDPDAASRTASNAGGSTGDNPGSVQADAFLSHTHSLARTTTGTFTANNGSQFSSGSTTPDVIGTTGGNETRPINLYVNYIIKT